MPFVHLKLHLTDLFTPNSTKSRSTALQDTVFEDSRVSDVLYHDKQQTTSVVDGPHMDTRVRNHLIDNDIEASTLSV